MKADGQGSGLSSPTSATKKVCFADLVGLKLEFVKIITPCSSDDNLCSAIGARKSHCDINENLPRRRIKCLFPCFVRPAEQTDNFMKRVYSQNVCLENIACENFVVTGLIRVTNLSFIKEVTVRFTFNGWATYRDIWADYMSSCTDGKTDKFSFRVTVPHDFEVNRHMEFAICYRASDQEFWDNNDRKNYHIQCSEVFPEQL